MPQPNRVSGSRADETGGDFHQPKFSNANGTRGLKGNFLEQTVDL